MPRSYTAPINIGATTAQIDIFELHAATWPFRLAGFEFGQTSEVGDAQEEQLTLVLKRVTGSPTSGSGGGTSTFQAVDSGDTSALVTMETGNTTKLTGGTSVELRRFSWNVRQERLYQPPEQFWHYFAFGHRAVLELVTTPADSITGIVGWVEIEEMP